MMSTATPSHAYGGHTSTVVSMPPPRNVHKRSPRFNFWCCFFLFSLIICGSSIEATDRVQLTGRGITNQKWAVACSIVTFFISLIVVIMHMIPIASIFIVATRVEGILAFAVTCLWATLVASVCDCGNGLAVDTEGAVIFGNLYFYSWGGFFSAIGILVNYLKMVYMVEASEQLNKRANRFDLWIACLVSHLVLMSAAANVYDYSCDEARFGTKWCNRALLAIAMGCVGSALSIVIVGMKMATGTAPFGLECLFCVFLFCTNCFSLGLVTCEDGPGTKVGNLFFFSWLSMIVPFLIMSACYEYWFESQEEKQTGGVDGLAGLGETGEAYDPSPATNKGTFVQMSTREHVHERQSFFSGEVTKRGTGGQTSDDAATAATGASDRSNHYGTREQEVDFPPDRGDRSTVSARQQASTATSYYGDDRSIYSDFLQKPTPVGGGGGGDYNDSFASAGEESSDGYPRKPNPNYYSSQRSVGESIIV
eukprot:CAMPEP_0194029638 /NCGR_PEP_ID=MMETSP0009_2-20130614/3314_1 /TAXON_ID=210454 /ORGANISM="Grammatophora oceanica, Strain CCMP 410" /LENGTH=479 /DNA_ID=CAMNT_0038669365 /DNA_START=27 /DNA_END=1466 /DNA_ORIENTATION=+